jgi:hypothetical protein
LLVAEASGDKMGDLPFTLGQRRGRARFRCRSGGLFTQCVRSRTGSIHCLTSLEGPVEFGFAQSGSRRLFTFLVES